MIEQNKTNAVAFYDLMFNKANPTEAINLYVGDDYIQHNPYVEDGKQGFIDYFNSMAVKYPHKKVEVKKVIAEGNFVVLHCLQQWPGDKDYASIDIFRFTGDGKIVEHWDVLQTLPEESKNNNSLF